MNATARRRLLSRLLPVLTVPTVLLGAAAPATAASPSCSITVNVVPLGADGVVLAGYVTVTVKNLRDVPSTGWRFTLTYPDTVRTTAYWNDELTSPDQIGTVAFRSIAWNSVVPSKGTADAGLTVVVSEGASPGPRAWTCSMTT